MAESAPLKEVASPKGNLDVDAKQSVEIVHSRESAAAPKEPSANSAGKDDALGNKRLRKQVRKSDQKNALTGPLAPEFEKAR